MELFGSFTANLELKTCPYLLIFTFTQQNSIVYGTLNFKK